MSWLFNNYSNSRYDLFPKKRNKKGKIIIRKSLYRKDWYVKREEALRRDKFKCKICSETKPLHVHHINHNKYNCDLSNLITLCAQCHRWCHNKSRQDEIQEKLYFLIS